MIKRVAIQSDGKIIAAGNATNGNNTCYYVYRVTEKGDIDTSLGFGGYIVEIFDEFNANLTSLTIQSDDSFIIGGNINQSQSTYNTLHKFTKDGLGDTSFGQLGTTTFNYGGVEGNQYDFLADVSIQKVDGKDKIVVAGEAGEEDTKQCALARFNADGSIDETFGENGYVITDFSDGTGTCTIKSIQIQPDGKIVAGVTVWIDEYKTNTIDHLPYFAVGRFNVDGTLDNSFGVKGKVLTKFAGDGGFINEILLEKDGTIVCGGQGYSEADGENVFALVRYIGGSAMISDVCFPRNTPISTDQGPVYIQEIDPTKHTIRSKKIVAITKTVSTDKHLICFEKDCLGKNVPSNTTRITKNHTVFYKGKMIKAMNFVGNVAGVSSVKYSGEILYNVLLETHDKMVVNNLICETLHPKNPYAKIFTAMKDLNGDEQREVVEALNEHITKKKIFVSNTV
jgi:hypothetical protein